MTKPKLTYFDAAGSRGEECRLALWCAGVDFDDVRIARADWPALKDKTPFGGLPTFELPGRPVLAQSNAILVYVGREHGLHPADAFEAARHEAMMAYVEDLRAAVSPTLRIADPDDKRRAREALAREYLPQWGARAERQVATGPFFGGAQLHVVDLKLFMIVRWFASGSVDHVPSDVFAPYPKLVGVHDAVRSHARVRSWYERT